MTEKTRRLTLLRELVVSGGVGAGQHLAIDDVVRVASDAGLRYSSRDNLYSDLDMLASEELVSCVKPGNAGCILVTIRPKAIALVEEMTETESRGSETLSRLVLLYDQRHKFLKDGPNSESAIAWFAEIGSLLQAVDPAYAESFHELSGYLTLPLSTYSLGPVWNQIQQVIMEAIFRLQHRYASSQHAYSPGFQYDLFRDIRDLLQKARRSVFVVEPYPNEDVFDLYVAAVASTVSVRLLTKNTTPSFRKVFQRYRKKPGVRIEAKTSTLIHDRVIIIDETDVWALGQSLKDAATTKPTYLVRVNLKVIMDQYEMILQSAAALG